MKKRKYNLTIKNNINGYLFLLPWLIGFLIFTFWPFLYTFYLSFCKVDASTNGFTTKWIGTYNYQVIFKPATKLPEFFPSMVNFVIMQSLYVPIILVISFILGLLLNQEIKFRTAFRTIFFLPVIILSGSVMSKFLSTGATNIGEVQGNLLFQMVGNYTPIVTTVLQYIFNNFAIVLWFTGIPIILFINALQKIDRQLFEAAQIDGANFWQILWKIIIPNIKLTAMIVCVYTIINLGMYSINARSNGVIKIYDLINRDLQNTTEGLGIASAETAMYSIVVLLLVFIVMFLFKDRYKPKKYESLQERQLKNLRRIQKRNHRNELTIKQYLGELKTKLNKKGDENSGK